MFGDDLNIDEITIVSEVLKPFLKNLMVRVEEGSLDLKFLWAGSEGARSACFVLNISRDECDTYNG